jgi:NitT/TauT family transport system substrate-binding protein
MKGLQYTVDHPDEAAAILNKAEPTAAVPAAVGEINAMKPYVPAPAGGPLGSFRGCLRRVGLVGGEGR